MVGRIRVLGMLSFFGGWLGGKLVMTGESRAFFYFGSWGFYLGRFCEFDDLWIFFGIRDRGCGF